MQTVVQRGALIFGVLFLLIGILGFFVPNGASMNADMDTAGRLFGLFPINLLHNLVHLGFGIWGIAAAASVEASRTFGRVGAVVYAALVLIALFDPTLFGLVPIGGHDIWLHAILAIGLGYIGFAAPARQIPETV